jgi:hypothetical protein
MVMSSDELPAHLQAVVDLLRAAFPAGVSRDDMDPLLVVLWEGLSEENLGVVVEKFTGEDRHRARHQAVTAVNEDRNRRLDRARISRVETLLVEHGWDPEAEF